MFKTSFYTLNLCSSAVNSQRLLCSQKACVMYAGIQNLLFSRSKIVHYFFCNIFTQKLIVILKLKLFVLSFLFLASVSFLLEEDRKGHNYSHNSGVTMVTVCDQPTNSNLHKHKTSIIRK